MIGTPFNQMTGWQRIQLSLVQTVISLAVMFVVNKRVTGPIFGKALADELEKRGKLFGANVGTTKSH